MNPRPAHRSLSFAVAALALSCGGPPERTGPPVYEFVDLGIPPAPRSVIRSAVSGTTLLATLFETKGEGRLLEKDLETGDEREHPLPRTTGAYALVVDDRDRVAYVGTFRLARVWRFELETRALAVVDALTPFLEGSSHVFGLGLGEQGRVYVGTYPTGRVLEYDPRADRVRDLGVPLDGRVYVRALFVGSDGRVYCALGTPAAIAVWEPGSGRWSIAAEAEQDGLAFATIRRQGSSLVGTVGGEPVLLSEHEPEDRWRRGGLAEDVAVSRDGGYEIELAGRTLTGHLDLTAKQDGMMTMGLFPGSRGEVYGATYWNASLFRIEAGGTAIEPLGRVYDASGEFRVGMPLSGDRLLLPGYGGSLYLYAEDRPWRDEPPGPNPRKLGEIGKGQHLATAVAQRADGLVAIATPPNYGRQGGALTLFDQQTLAWRSFDGLAGDRSISAVCFGGDGRVYVGTSLTVGHGARAVDGPGEVLAVEPDTGAVTGSFSPFPEARNVVQLMDVGGGRILGAANRKGPPGVVFLYDTATGDVTVVHSFDGQLRDLAWWPQEEVAVALVWRGGVYAVDPRTGGVEKLPGGPETAMPGVAFDGLGNGYVHDGTRVYRFHRE